MANSFGISNPAALHTLINALVQNHEGSLEQLSGAMRVPGLLGEVPNNLIGYFADQAQQGPPDLAASQGFSRFADAVRNGVVHPQNEAHTADSATIAPSHQPSFYLACSPCRIPVPSRRW